jgi:uncharacterized membrane protein SpoIIM required for sporulation
MNVIAALTLVVSAIALLVFVSFLLSYPVFLLWNGCLVGAVAGVVEVTWLQAWGLTVLCAFLFKPSTSK